MITWSRSAFLGRNSKSLTINRCCDCQYCRVGYDLGEGTKVRAAISCKLMVQEGMRVKEVAMEINYGLRDLHLTQPKS